MIGSLSDVPTSHGQEPAGSSVRASLLNYLQRTVKFLTLESMAGGERPAGAGVTLDDSHCNVSLLCDALERTLSFNLRPPSLLRSFLGSSSSGLSLWPMVVQLSQRVAWMKETVAWIQKDVHNDVDRTRAFIRSCLNQKRLADACAALADDQALMRKFYERDAVLMREDDREVFLTLLRHLASLDFRLTLNVYDDRLGSGTSRARAPVPVPAPPPPQRASSPPLSAPPATAGSKASAMGVVQGTAHASDTGSTPASHSVDGSLLPTPHASSGSAAGAFQGNDADPPPPAPEAVTASVGSGDLATTTDVTATPATAVVPAAAPPVIVVVSKKSRKKKRVAQPVAISNEFITPMPPVGRNAESSSPVADSAASSNSPPGAQPAGRGADGGTGRSVPSSNNPFLEEPVEPLAAEHGPQGADKSVLGATGDVELALPERQPEQPEQPAADQMPGDSRALSRVVDGDGGKRGEGVAQAGGDAATPPSSTSTFTSENGIIARQTRHTAKDGGELAEREETQPAPVASGSGGAGTSIAVIQPPAKEHVAAAGAVTHLCVDELAGGGSVQPETAEQVLSANVSKEEETVEVLEGKKVEDEKLLLDAKEEVDDGAKETEKEETVAVVAAVSTDETESNDENEEPARKVEEIDVGEDDEHDEQQYLASSPSGNETSVTSETPSTDAQHVQGDEGDREQETATGEPPASFFVNDALLKLAEEASITDRQNGGAPDSAPRSTPPGAAAAASSTKVKSKTAVKPKAPVFQKKKTGGFVFRPGGGNAARFK